MHRSLTKDTWSIRTLHLIPVNTYSWNSLIRTIILAPRVSILESFHCNTLFLPLTCPAPTGTKCVFGRCCPYPDRMGFHTLHVVSIMREGKSVSLRLLPSCEERTRYHVIMAIHVLRQHSKGKNCEYHISSIRHWLIFFSTVHFCAATIRGQHLFLWKAHRHQRQLDKIRTRDSLVVCTASQSCCQPWKLTHSRAK